MPLSEAVFLANGNWTCPAGVTKALIIGAGGGGGGGSGSSNLTEASGGAGGGGALQGQEWVTVVPGTVYAITIGTGGTGGAAVTVAVGLKGNQGNNTTFGSLATFSAASGGGGGTTTAGTNSCGGESGELQGAAQITTAAFLTSISGIATTHGFANNFACGGSTWTLTAGFNGNRNTIGGFEAGQGGGSTASAGGGAGGGSGPAGAGANGGAGVSSGAANAGSNAAANSGAGGGGGGGQGTAASASGAGGSGGSGYLYVIWLA